MSMKKSLLLLLAVIAAVTLFTVMTSGSDSMQIDMSDTAISFSGIGDFQYAFNYSDVVSAELTYEPDWDMLTADHESGNLRCGNGFSEAYGSYTLYVTTQARCVAVVTLSDGSTVIFNYNNTIGTEDIYYLLLDNIVQAD